MLPAVVRKSIDRVEDRTLILADIAEKAIAQAKGAVKQSLIEHMKEADAERAATMLSIGAWTHDHPLTADVAKTPRTADFDGARSGVLRPHAALSAAGATARGGRVPADSARAGRAASRAHEELTAARPPAPHRRCLAVMDRGGRAKIATPFSAKRT